MVNSSRDTAPLSASTPLPAAAAAIRVYLILVIATLVGLVILAFTASPQATSNAWGHAIVVAVFAVVLPLRLRSAQAGRRSAIQAVGLISAVLFLVNVIEALIPGFVPAWMRAQMYVVAVLMLVVVLDVVRWVVIADGR
ncbi:hypothetical protein BA895_19775 [Humibacillus sp. DSM 29435]|uniref:hypothetical protein n=1 Tax=Humibacillus sp. DSM 29435 TaxID=1869167 RepID=UPI000872DD12|nr:hypothetical protein [Humibacillus sp. DSM 29435]OFE16286.1 hypothetical protein BA895_19775 [Humibacillus sp. DSM 29435]